MSDPGQRGSGRQGGRKARGRRKGRKRGAERAGRPAAAPDPSDTPDSEIRYIQPYDATKTYRCPGCNRDIPPGTHHLVAVPPHAPDLRRHWHNGCWTHRNNRY